MSTGKCPCNVLNRHIHPEPTETCDECCCMCVGYCCPAGVAVLIVALVVAYIVFFILVMKDYPDAWRIVVSILFIVIVIALCAAVMWSYYKVIFTAPGFVERDPWKHKPHYRPLETGLEAAAAAAPPGSAGGTVRRLSRGGSGADSPGGSAGEMHNRKDGSAVLDEGSSNDQLLQRRGRGDDGQGKVAELSTASDGRFSSSQGGDRPLRGAAEGSQRGDGAGPGPAREEAGEREHEDQVAVPVGDRPRSHSPYDPPNQRALVERETGLRPTQGSAENPFIVSRLDRWGNMRYCSFCNVYKPDSAYHCGVCNRCVYNFDHHCPYINNCVGRNNYKLFVIFLLYSSVACIIAGGLMVIGIFAMDEREVLDKIGWIAVPLVMIVLGGALGVFYIEHRCLLCRGKSTVENVVQQRIDEEKRRQRGYNPFSAKRRQYDAEHKKAARAERELTPEERQLVEAKRQERIQEHRRSLWGDEKGWRAYYPKAIREDNTPEGIPRV